MTYLGQEGLATPRRTGEQNPRGRGQAKTSELVGVPYRSLGRGEGGGEREGGGEGGSGKRGEGGGG